MGRPSATRPTNTACNFFFGTKAGFYYFYACGRCPPLLFFFIYYIFCSNERNTEKSLAIWQFLQAELDATSSVCINRQCAYARWKKTFLTQFRQIVLRGIFVVNSVLPDV